MNRKKREGKGKGSQRVREEGREGEVLERETEIREGKESEGEKEK